MSIYEYDEEKHMRQERQEFYLEGHADGRAEGIAEGHEKGLAEGIAEGIAEGLAEGREKGLAEGIAKGHEKGMKEGAATMLYTLAGEGLISVDTAAEKAGMPVSFFREKMTEYLAGSIKDDN